MSPFQKGKIPNLRLLVVAVCAIAVIAAVEYSKKRQKDPAGAYKLAAAKLMKGSLEAIKEERLKRGIAINIQDDPNQTGIIGLEYTDLTTTLGSLSAKRTSSNPNYAGIIVEMLFRAGVRVKDPVAISFSGSFPALNIAVLSAAKSLELDPAIISSVGASMYGANQPGLTWLDMERILIEHKILPYASVAASLGGIIDTKGGLDGKGIDMGLEAIRRNGVRYINELGRKTLTQDIEKRLTIYKKAFGAREPAAFINVGGNDTALGNCPEAYALSTGLLSRVPSSDHPQRGIIFRMNENGIPVIHLLNIKKIARQYGLPVDPVPLPPVPSGKVMVPHTYSRGNALLGLIVLCLLIGAASRVRLRASHDCARSSLSR